MWAQILAGVLVLNIALQIVTAYAIPRWFPIQRDASHPYAIHFKGGPIYYVQPWVGVYTDYGLWIGFALVTVFVILLWVNRDQLERT